MTTPPANPNAAEQQDDPEDRRKNLDHIQVVIARLAGASNAAKGWSLTIATVAFGFSALAKAWYLVLLGLAVILSFSILDSYYLYEERLFRRLHKDVAAGTVRPFSMDKDKYKGQESKRKTYFSWSVVAFYAPLAAAGITVAVISASSSEDSDEPYKHRPHGLAATPDGTASRRA